MGKTRIGTGVAVLAMVAAACSPIAAGPELPRPHIAAMPAPPSTTPSTAPAATTTTTIDPVEVAATECPDEFCLVYNIVDEATWSDGAPVTGEAFQRTYEAALAEAPASSAAGYRLITDIDVLEEKRVRVAFSRPYGAWRGLFSRLLGPNEATSGPFVVSDFVLGDRIVVERVPDWWADQDPVSGAPTGDVQEITFVFIDEPAEMVDALEDGDIQVMLTRPDADTVSELGGIEDVQLSVTPGRFWEHIEFHHDDSLLSQFWVREALALATDRQAILAATAQVLEPNSVALGNTLLMARDRGYEDHFQYDYDTAAAERLLAENGCEPGEDGIQVCAGTRLSFVWATTNDDPARQAAFDIVSADFAEIGIELVLAARTPSAFASTEFLLGGPDRWQLANFAWRAGDDPSEAVTRYDCDESVFNVNGYCSPEIEALFASASSVVDRGTRRDLYNDADALYLNDLAVIPLYQKPELMAWTSELAGPIPNHSSSSDLWNVAAWTGLESIVVAIPQAPTSLDPFVTVDENANRILATLMYGALAMDPSLESLHVLVDSVDIVEG